MHNVIEQLRKFTTRNFSVTVKAVEDWDLDLSFDETGETRRDIERGALVPFGVVVTVYSAQGAKLGEDSLWGCIYARPVEFMDHLGIKAKSRADGCRYGSYFSDMIRQAIAEARKAVSAMRALPLHN